MISPVEQQDPFQDLVIPAALQSSLSRHREHLAVLVHSLRSAGLSEEQIEANVSVLVDSYKQELLRAIKGLVN